MHGTDGKRFDRVTGTWLDAAEHARRTAEYEERAFNRRLSQGQLAAPTVIRDGMRPVQSQATGKIHDSKSELRKEYRREGVIEVGNDVPMKKPEPTYYEKKAERLKIKAAIHRAHSQVGLGAP